jgi:hypothetical protein
MVLKLNTKWRVDFFSIGRKSPSTRAAREIGTDGLFSDTTMTNCKMTDNSSKHQLKNPFRYHKKNCHWSKGLQNMDSMPTLLIILRQRFISRSMIDQLRIKFASALHPTAPVKLPWNQGDVIKRISDQFLDGGWWSGPGFWIIAVP